MTPNQPLGLSKMAAEATLEVCELFRSITGETTHAGRPAAFLRVAGCNLRCRWCDTRYAWEPGRKISVLRAAELLCARGDRLLVVTGGEPLLQPGSVRLCRELLSWGREVLLETNGSLDVSYVPEGVRIVLDIKAPRSGEHRRMDLKNLHRLRPGDEVKLVLADRDDFGWACRLLDGHSLPEGVQVLFSPASGLLEPGKLADWLLASGRTERMQLQVHKILWPGGAEGEQILDESGDSL